MTPEQAKQAAEKKYPLKEETHTGDSTYNSVQRILQKGFIAGANAGSMRWRDAIDFPEKSGNYITEIVNTEGGVTYRPVEYNRFDAEYNTWECPYKVTKWLDESTGDYWKGQAIEFAEWLGENKYRWLKSSHNWAHGFDDSYTTSELFNKWSELKSKV